MSWFLLPGRRTCNTWLAVIETGVPSTRDSSLIWLAAAGPFEVTQYSVPETGSKISSPTARTLKTSGVTMNKLPVCGAAVNFRSDDTYPALSPS